MGRIPIEEGGGGGGMEEIGLMGGSICMNCDIIVSSYVGCIC